MKKLSKIDESIWADIHKRSNGVEIRKEDGRKVKTCLGTTITIKDSACDYDYWIKKIIESDPNISYGLMIDLSKYTNLTPDEMANVSKWEAPYDYLIYDGPHGTSLIAYFYSYSDLVEYESDIAECLSEEDYISLCRGIALKLKEVGQYFSHVPQRNAYIIGSRSGNCKYSGDYVLKLIDETDTSYYFSNNENVDIEDFANDICDRYTELKDVDFISWTFYDGNNIGIPLTVNNLVNFNEYKKFTQSWFASDETNESVWADIHKRSNGTQTRKEDDPNLLDAQGFVEYLRDIYKNVNTNFYIFKDLNDVITVPMFETELGTKSTWFIQYDCTDNSVFLWDHFLNKDDKLFDKLKRKYKLTFIKREFTENFLIEPKTGKSSNKFFIEIIDFLLENTSVFFTRILVKKDNMNESVWGDIHKRSSGQQIRKEDIKPQDYENWWRNIPLDDAPKYKKDELRLWDFLYDFIWKFEKAMNIKSPDVIRIYFKYEDAWYLSIFHNTAYGSDNYTMEANGTKRYNPIKYSEMSIQEKRSIKYRLENKKFYAYKYSNEYVLREEPEFDGKKGVELK